MMSRPPRAFVIAVVAVVAALVPLAMSVLGNPIKGSRHDLSGLNMRGYGVETGPMTGATFNDYKEICVYCHTPHNAAGDAPLWNREMPAQSGYLMYSSPNFDSRADAPDGISLACLSCHDGTVAVDAIRNKPQVPRDRRCRDALQDGSRRLARER
jgi:hypothetical protein